MILMLVVISAILVAIAEASAKSAAANATAEVITCDANSLFSSYGLCGPGRCCSNIPIGITASILVLTIAVVVMTIMVLRSLKTAPQPPQNAPSKNNLVTQNEPQPGPSTSSSDPPYPIAKH